MGRRAPEPHIYAVSPDAVERLVAPDGRSLNWGAWTAGTVLAAADILERAVDGRVGDELVDAFARGVMARLPTASFSLTVTDVVAWLTAEGAHGA